MAKPHVLFSVMLCAVVAGCNDTPGPTDAPARVFSYGSPGCFPGMTPTQVCQYFHGTTAVATSYCMYGDCFDMSYGELVKIVAADEQGEYPQTWFTWGDCSFTTNVGLQPCVLSAEGHKKTRINFPAGSARCMTSATVGSTTYFEHFASAPATQCMGWLECKMPVEPVP